MGEITNDSEMWQVLHIICVIGSAEDSWPVGPKSPLNLSLPSRLQAVLGRTVPRTCPTALHMQVEVRQGPPYGQRIIVGVAAAVPVLPSQPAA